MGDARREKARKVEAPTAHGDGDVWVLAKCVIHRSVAVRLAKFHVAHGCLRKAETLRFIINVGLKAVGY